MWFYECYWERMYLKYPGSETHRQRHLTRTFWSTCIYGKIWWDYRYMGVSSRLQLCGYRQPPEWDRYAVGRYIPRMGECQKHRFLSVSRKGFQILLERVQWCTHAQFLCTIQNNSRTRLGKTKEDNGSICRYDYPDNRESFPINSNNLYIWNFQSHICRKNDLPSLSGFLWRWS